MAAGFDCDLVELQPEKIQTVCPICLLILREPRQGTCCGKIYCQTCITKVLKEDNRCPMCREPRPHFWPDKHTKQQLFGLRVFCPHRAKDGTRPMVAGCGWQGELGYLEKHINAKPRTDVVEAILDGCTFATLKCHLCGVLIQRSDMKSHLLCSCPKRPYTCQYCGHKDTYIQIISVHAPSCPKEPIPCLYCEEIFERQVLDCHIVTDCELVPVLCGFSTVGCEVELPRKDMASHLKEAIESHIKLLHLHTEEHFPLFASCLEVLVSEKQVLLTQIEGLLSKEKQLRCGLEKLSSEKKQLQLGMTFANDKFRCGLEKLAAEKQQLERDLVSANQKLCSDLKKLEAEKQQLQCDMVSANQKFCCDLETLGEELQSDMASANEKLQENLEYNLTKLWTKYEQQSQEQDNLYKKLESLRCNHQRLESHIFILFIIIGIAVAGFVFYIILLYKNWNP